MREAPGGAVTGTLWTYLPSPGSSVLVRGGRRCSAHGSRRQTQQVKLRLAEIVTGAAAILEDAVIADAFAELDAALMAATPEEPVRRDLRRLPPVRSRPATPLAVPSS